MPMRARIRYGRHVARRGTGGELPADHEPRMHFRRAEQGQRSVIEIDLDRAYKYAGTWPVGRRHA